MKIEFIRYSGNKDAPVDNGDNNGHTDKEGQRATSKRSATCDSAAAVHDQFINNGGSSGNMQNGTEGGTASNGYRLPGMSSWAECVYG